MSVGLGKPYFFLINNPYHPPLLSMLQGSTSSVDGMSNNDGGPQFAEVFVIYWCGAAVVTLNTKLLGGNM